MVQVSKQTSQKLTLITSIRYLFQFIILRLTIRDLFKKLSKGVKACGVFILVSLHRWSTYIIDAKNKLLQKV